MNNEALEFHGLFALWSYTVGHGRLLIRRTKSAEHPRRVDVLFKDVGWMSVPTSIDDLTVREVPFAAAGAPFSHAGPLRTTNRRMFELQGGNQKGFVFAGLVAWAEDEGEYNDESSLMD